MTTKREQLLQQAYGQHQYDGYWDDWVVGRVTRNVRTKVGLAFERGDLVLLDPTRVETVNGKAHRTAYSWRNRCNTSLPASHIVDDTIIRALHPEFTDICTNDLEILRDTLAPSDTRWATVRAEIEWREQQEAAFIWAQEADPQPLGRLCWP